MWGRMRAREEHGVNKMDAATNSQTQKWKEKLEIQKEVGIGVCGGGVVVVGSSDHCFGWGLCKLFTS